MMEQRWYFLDGLARNFPPLTFIWDKTDINVWYGSPEVWVNYPAYKRAYVPGHERSWTLD